MKKLSQLQILKQTSKTHNNQIGIKQQMHRLLLLVCLLALSNTASIVIGGVTYMVTKCTTGTLIDFFSMSNKASTIKWGDVKICNTNHQLFISVSSYPPITYNVESITLQISSTQFATPSTSLDFTPITVQQPSSSPWGKIIDIPTNIKCNSSFYIITSVNFYLKNTLNACEADLKRYYYSRIAYQAQCLDCQTDISNQACVWNCQTGYGFGTNNFSSFGLKRWGWATLIKSGQTLTNNIYAGAGQNVIEKSTNVGQVKYSTINGYTKVKFTLSSNCRVTTYHIYIGDSLPTDITANGKFPYKGGPIKGGVQVSVPSSSGVAVVDKLKDGIWIIAHFDVCCVPPETI